MSNVFTLTKRKPPRTCPEVEAIIVDLQRAGAARQEQERKRLATERAMFDLENALRNLYRILGKDSVEANTALLTAQTQARRYF